MRAATLMGSIAAMLLAGACTPPDKAPTPAAEDLTIAPAPVQAPDVVSVPVLHAGGFGPLTIGMTRDEVIALAGQPDAPLSPDYESEACETFTPAGFPQIEVMITDGVLARVSLDSDAFATDRGFGVNSAAVDIKAAYGDAIEAGPHKYAEAPAEYLTAWETGDGASPESRGVRYETDEERLVAFVHGGGPSIQYVEGCL